MVSLERGDQAGETERDDEGERKCRTMKKYASVRFLGGTPYTASVRLLFGQPPLVVLSSLVKGRIIGKRLPLSTIAAPSEAQEGTQGRRVADTKARLIRSSLTLRHELSFLIAPAFFRGHLRERVSWHSKRESAPLLQFNV